MYCGYGMQALCMHICKHACMHVCTYVCMHGKQNYLQYKNVAWPRKIGSAATGMIQDCGQEL